MRRSSVAERQKDEGEQGKGAQSGSDEDAPEFVPPATFLREMSRQGHTHPRLRAALNAYAEARKNVRKQKSREGAHKVCGNVDDVEDAEGEQVLH